MVHEEGIVALTESLRQWLILVGSVLLGLGVGAANAEGASGPAARHPLAPLDTSSPRATLTSFLGVIPEFEEAVTAYLAAPSRDRALRVLRVRDRASRVMDLSALPPAALRQRGGQALYLLLEVLARLELPPLEQVPDATAFTPDSRRDRWTIPNTEITIARIATGPRAGEFLFSAETVARLGEFYSAVEHLPFLRSMPLGSPRLMALETTGWMVPQGLVAALPAWSRRPLMDTPVWKLVAALLLVLLCVIAVVLLRGRTRPRGQDLSPPVAYLRRLVVPVVVFLLALWLRFFIGLQINLQGDAAQALEFALAIVRYLSAAWGAYLAAMLVAEWIISSPRIPDESLDANLLRLGAGFVGLVGAVVLIASGASDLGVPVFGIVAGLGVGGLAVALAAQSTLGNLLGTLNLFADRPVRVGDVCRYGDKMGRIESIGLRSTRIRGTDRTVTTIPNAELAQMAIINFSQRDRMLFLKRLDLRYETTPDQLRLVLIRLREMLLAHPRVGGDQLHVRLVELASSSIQIEIQAYVTTRSGDEFLGVQEDLLLRIVDLVVEAGTGFAFPSQTAYLARDRGPTAADAAKASAAIEALRAQQALPFPEFSPERRAELRGTLDFPPTGSPQATRERQARPPVS